LVQGGSTLMTILIIMCEDDFKRYEDIYGRVE